MVLGLLVGQWLLLHRSAGLEQIGVIVCRGRFGAPFRALALLGRWSLSYYMLHQPLLMGALSLFALLH